MYAVKEIFYTLQGEGANAGRAAVFCRFAGCNLWSGREQDRAKADCQILRHRFCRRRRRRRRAVRVRCPNWRMPARRWRVRWCHVLVVLTGGEPMLQVDGELIDALHRRGFHDRHRDQRHVARSARYRLDLRQPQGRHRLATALRRRIEARLPAGRPRPQKRLRGWHSPIATCSRWTVQDAKANTDRAIAYCKAHPEWRLSLQMQQAARIP